MTSDPITRVGTPSKAQFLASMADVDGLDHSCVELAWDGPDTPDRPVYFFVHYRGGLLGEGVLNLLGYPSRVDAAYTDADWLAELRTWSHEQPADDPVPGQMVALAEDRLGRVSAALYSFMGLLVGEHWRGTATTRDELLAHTAHLLAKMLRATLPGLRAVCAEVEGTDRIRIPVLGVCLSELPPDFTKTGLN